MPVSYINNLHPMKHRGQYDSIGKIITQTIPLWEKSLSSRHFEEDRIKYTEVKYGEHLEPEPIPALGRTEFRRLCRYS